MAENPINEHPRSRELALSSLRVTPGWSVYCERFAKILETQIDEKIWDLKTSDEDCMTLRAARKLLTDAHAPEKMLESMIAQARSAADTLDRSKKT